MTIIIKYILIYISIILGSTVFSTIFNKRIEKTIALDIFIKIIVLYIFGIIGFLKIGTYVVLYLPIILGIFILIKNRKEKETIVNNVFTIGLGFFSIIYFGFAITTFAKVSNLWDEYSYWSLASKNMFYHNSLLNYEGMKMNILYPPVPTIWQYFFTSTIGIYKQGIEIFASQILSFAMLLPLFEKVTKESKVIVKICISIMILCLPCIFTYFYESIYVDALLGIIIGYIFMQMYKENNKKISFICVGCAFCLLALTKATGFYIALILIAVMVLQKIIEKYCKIKTEKATEKNNGEEKLKLYDKIKKLIKEEKQTILTIFIFVCIIISSFVSYQYVMRDQSREGVILKLRKYR